MSTYWTFMEICTWPSMHTSREHTWLLTCVVQFWNKADMLWNIVVFCECVSLCDTVLWIDLFWFFFVRFGGKSPLLSAFPFISLILCMFVLSAAVPVLLKHPAPMTKPKTGGNCHCMTKKIHNNTSTQYREPGDTKSRQNRLKKVTVNGNLSPVFHFEIWSAGGSFLSLGLFKGGICYWFLWKRKMEVFLRSYAISHWPHWSLMMGGWHREAKEDGRMGGGKDRAKGYEGACPTDEAFINA